MGRKRHGHHGGAWKVAYADFVTAMMALFLVLWLTSQDQKIKEAVERSFKHPFSPATQESAGIIPMKGTAAMGRSKSGSMDSSSAVELSVFRRLSQDLFKLLQENGDNPEDAQVKLDITPEGMRISVFDRAWRPIFNPDSAEFTEYGRWVFSSLAWELARYNQNFLIELEGHAEAGLALKSETYSLWELTADRANSARRLLLQHGVSSSQIRRVAGYADTLPMASMDPEDERNRRVAVLLKVKGKI